jgi:radical SAM superfamily enzyme YgiQ (UPF0313 family)
MLRAEVRMARIALVGPEIEENLSLRYLAAAVEARGHRVDIVPFDATDGFGPALARTLSEDDEAPLLVGLSLAFQWRAPDFLALAVALRECGYRGHITAGGHFGTFACEPILGDFPEIDSICRQEAESTLPALCDALRDGAPLDVLPGLAFRRAGAVVLTGLPELPDLSALPFPDRRGEPARCFGHGIAPLVSSRGCYANCSFCCIAAWHEQTLPGKRYRLRDMESVADEMAAQHRERGVDIFVFHDDNFFIPNHAKSKERLLALADALDRRGVREFATVVKARSNDVDPSVFSVLVERLRCIRCYVGVENDADQGLVTLNRWATQRSNHRAVDIARALDLFICFNVLLFDPDTTLESLDANIAFMEFAADMPFNFGRVELYAGTPLLARLQNEGRARGDYLRWEYDVGRTPSVERAYRLALRAFRPRNFGEHALANDIQATRFDVEVARRFHGEVLPEGLRADGVELSRQLALGTARGLRRVVEHVRAGAGDDDGLVRDVSAELRAQERTIRKGCVELAARLERLLGRGPALTWMGDKVATPLQHAALEIMP